MASVEDVFEDFKGRRAAIIRALTTDVNDFYMQCDPQKGKLCLYGFPNGQWKVILPLPWFPQPTVGINLERDEMQMVDWLSLVASNSNKWLSSATFHLCAVNGFNQTKREHLFYLINQLLTVDEVVTREAVTKCSSTKSKTNSEVVCNPKAAVQGGSDVRRQVATKVRPSTLPTIWEMPSTSSTYSTPMETNLPVWPPMEVISGRVPPSSSSTYPFMWPPSKAEDKLINLILYENRPGKKRLPVFAEICPE